MGGDGVEKRLAHDRILDAGGPRRRLLAGCVEHRFSGRMPAGLRYFEAQPEGQEGLRTAFVGDVDCRRLEKFAEQWRQCQVGF